MLRFACLVIFPIDLGLQYISALLPLVSTQEQDDDLVANSSELDAVAGTVVNTKFQYAFTDSFRITKIAKLDARQACINSLSCSAVSQTVKPFEKRAPSVACVIVENLLRRLDCSL